MNHKTFGIVIRRSNFGEADRLLTIFTERFGKVKAIAKGVRKTKSHLGGSLEPFMLLDLQFYEGKTFFTVTGASIVEGFSELHNDLIKLSQTFYIGELIDKILGENQKSEQVFQAFSEALRSINNVSENVVFEYSKLKIIESAGFRPQLRECVHCRKELVPKNNFWDAVEGGVICGSCQEKFLHGKKISDQTIKILRLMDEGKIEMLKKVKLGPEIKAEIERVLSEYVESILERELRSEKFIKQISKQAHK